VVASRFLFDEQVFDPQYFREKMMESRERKKALREELRRLLASSRSGALLLTDLPCLDSIPGLAEDLEAFLHGASENSAGMVVEREPFDLDQYRDVILEYLDGCSAMFSALPRVGSDLRLDKARRFVALIFLWQERQVALTQYANDILVEKHEVDRER